MNPKNELMPKNNEDLPTKIYILRSFENKLFNSLELRVLEFRLKEYTIESKGAQPIDEPHPQNRRQNE